MQPVCNRGRALSMQIGDGGQSARCHLMCARSHLEISEMAISEMLSRVSTWSQSVPHVSTRILSCEQMSKICVRTSLTFFIAFAWMKCRTHQSARYPFFFHCRYTLSRVRWSDSGAKNFSRAASLSSSRSRGR